MQTSTTATANNGLNGGGDFVKNDGVFQDRRTDAGAETEPQGWTSKNHFGRRLLFSNTSKT